MSDHPINSMLDIAISRIKDMMTTSTVIGEPITFPNGDTAVPICKVSVGLGSGGSDLPVAKQGEFFGGGTGAGISITPIAFLVSTDKGIKLMQLDTIGTTADNVVRAVPEVIDKISGLLPKKDKKDKEGGN